jgi:hypothetical protein
MSVLGASPRVNTQAGRRRQTRARLAMWPTPRVRPTPYTDRHAALEAAAGVVQRRPSKSFRISDGGYRVTPHSRRNIGQEHRGECRRRDRERVGDGLARGHRAG